MLRRAISNNGEPSSGLMLDRTKKNCQVPSKIIGVDTWRTHYERRALIGPLAGVLLDMKGALSLKGLLELALDAPNYVNMLRRLSLLPCKFTARKVRCRI